MTGDKATARELEELLAKENFDEVLEVLAGIERSRPLAPRELVLRSRCIQLASGTGVPPLEEAEQALREALEDDDEYVPAILDLAWYYHAVEDDPAKALPWFERAHELSRQNLTEAVAGKADCLEELDSEAASAFLQKARSES
ncbi:MAG TPA: hypothetical protein VGH73_26405 [Thermoanaerobaculia bacterium]|jgi:tetratricopeptide (TPR) repeat protein